MARTLKDLRMAVAAFATRNESDFLISGQDCLLLAINLAKDAAQRAVDFEAAKVSTQLVISVLNGGDVSGMTIYGTTTPVLPKSLKRAFLSVGTLPIPVELISRDVYVQRIKRRFSGLSSLASVTDVITSFAPFPFVVIQVGTTVQIFPADTTQLGSGNVTLFFDILQWLPDFVQLIDGSFLFDFAFEYMIFRTLYYLNFLLKEDQRVAITSKMLDDTWTNVVQWNATYIASSTDDASLD